MNELRDKFLTEAMGKCWHEKYEHFESTFEDRYDKYKCKQCHRESSYTPHLPRMNFSTWKDFGNLYEWARKQSWWNQFAGNNLGTWSQNGKVVFIQENFIQPDKFSDALYEWGIHWFDSFGIVDRHKGTYEI